MAEIDTFIPVHIAIREDVHAVVIAQQARRLASQLGFSTVSQTALSTALLEIARNIVRYAGEGTITLDVIYEGEKCGISVIARDNGPGIPDLDLALTDGHSTGRGLGLGLPGARRLMDRFEIASEIGKGTLVVMQKWQQ